MLVNNDKMNFEAGKTKAQDPLSRSSSNNSKIDDSKISNVGLSQQGQNLNYLYQLSLSTAQKNPSPVYIGAEKRIEILANSVNEIARQSGYEYTPEQIKRVVEDVAKGVNITETQPGDVNASSGSVYSFLNSADKAKLADAYQHALDNNTSLDDVRFAAFSLARSRFIEAKINSGTTWAVYDPNENVSNIKSEDVEELETEKLTIETGSEYVKSLLEQFKEGKLFTSNPYLRTSLFQDVSSSLLMHRLPSFLQEKI